MEQVRQPWADVEVKPAQPTAEQREWLEKEGFIKDEEEGAEGDDDKEPGDRRRVRKIYNPSCPSSIQSCRSSGTYVPERGRPVKKLFQKDDDVTACVDI